MRTEKLEHSSYWIRRVDELAHVFPRSILAIGKTEFATLLRDYIDFFPKDDSDPKIFGRNLAKYLRYKLPWQLDPHLSELVRFEWVFAQSQNEIKLFASLYPLHKKSISDLKTKGRSLHHYALHKMNGAQPITFLTENEYRLLYWILDENSTDDILNKLRLLGLSIEQKGLLAQSLFEKKLINKDLFDLLTCSLLSEKI